MIVFQGIRQWSLQGKNDGALIQNCYYMRRRFLCKKCALNYPPDLPPHVEITDHDSQLWGVNGDPKNSKITCFSDRLWKKVHSDGTRPLTEEQVVRLAEWRNWQEKPLWLASSEIGLKNIVAIFVIIIIHNNLRECVFLHQIICKHFRGIFYHV